MIRAIPRFKRHADITSDQLNLLVDRLNEMANAHYEIRNLVAELKETNETNVKTIDTFVSQYEQVITSTPSILDLLNSYSLDAGVNIDAEEGDTVRA